MQKQSDTECTCCELCVETLLAEGLIPVDVVLDAIFGENSYAEVTLRSNFDPIPLRLKLKQLGCNIGREKSADGWLFSITRNAQQSPTPVKKTSDNKARFHFDSEILTMDVLGIEYPNNFLEVLRFMETSFDDDRLRVHIRTFPPKFQTLLSERGWTSLIENKQDDCVVLLLETTIVI